MDGKRLGLLHELMPSATRVGVLLNPNFPAYTEQLNDLQHAARIINLEVEILRANTDGEIETAFESSSQKRLEALVLAASPFFDNLFAPCQLLLIIIDNEHVS